MMVRQTNLVAAKSPVLSQGGTLSTQQRTHVIGPCHGQSFIGTLWNMDPRLNMDEFLELLKMLDQHILDVFEVYKSWWKCVFGPLPHDQGFSSQLVSWATMHTTKNDQENQPTDTHTPLKPTQTSVHLQKIPNPLHDWQQTFKTSEDFLLQHLQFLNHMTNGTNDLACSNIQNNKRWQYLRQKKRNNVEVGILRIEVGVQN